VIVRIPFEGQFALAEDAVDRLNELDNAAVAAVEAADEEALRAHLRAIHDYIVAEGTPVDPGDLVVSDVIMPPPDATLEEARADFTGDGLIPG